MMLFASLLFTTAALRSSHAIEIKLYPGQTVFEVQALYPDAQIAPLFTLPPERLLELSAVEEGLPDLTLWYKVIFPIASLVEQTEEEIAASLESLDSISDVGIPKNVVPPHIGSPQVRSASVHRSLAVTPSFVPDQGYLKMNSPTNNGIDAEYSWTFEGGAGEGVTIYDIEYGWNQLHEDLEVVRDVKLLLNEGDEAQLPPGPEFSNDHGTAVLGVMVGTENAIGIKGISHQARAGMAPEYTKNLGSNRGNAILLAVNDGKPGDIILLEIQTPVCGNPDPPQDSSDGYGPAEELQSVFDATKVATANGITVIATAGNGNVDLDATGCDGRYNRTVRDSGAVMVGAGGTGIKCSPGFDGAPREKLPFSTFGSRLDVHGWGECIWSTGYGWGYKDPDALDDENKWYTDAFSGTSGAGPIVASAAANIQGIAIKKFGTPLKPPQLRQLLTNTGLPQLGDLSKKIGPLVNLRAAIDTLIGNPLTTEPTARQTNRPTKQPTAKSTAIPTISSKAGKVTKPAMPTLSKSGKVGKTGKAGKGPKNGQGKVGKGPHGIMPATVGIRKRSHQPPLAATNTMAPIHSSETMEMRDDLVEP